MDHCFTSLEKVHRDAINGSAMRSIGTAIIMLL